MPPPTFREDIRHENMLKFIFSRGARRVDYRARQNYRRSGARMAYDDYQLITALFSWRQLYADWAAGRRRHSPECAIPATITRIRPFWAYSPGQPRLSRDIVARCRRQCHLRASTIITTHT